MASHTAFLPEMIPVVMVTAAAQWDDIDIFRRVSLMAISTEVLVSLTLDTERKQDIVMALAAVVDINCGFNIPGGQLCLCLQM